MQRNFRFILCIFTIGLFATFAQGAPSPNDQIVNMIQNSSKLITLTCTNPDDDPVTFGIYNAPGHGTLSAITQLSNTQATVAYTPTPGYVGSDSFSFYVNNLDFGVGIVSINISTLPPTAQSSSVQTVQNMASAIQLIGTSPFGNLLTFSIDSNPSHGTLSSITQPTSSGSTQSALVYYTPNSGYAGTDSFTFRVNNGLNSPVATVTITIISLPVLAQTAPLAAKSVPKYYNTIVTGRALS